MSWAPSGAEFVKHPASRNFNHSFFRIPADGRHYTETNGEPLLFYDNGEPAVTRLGNVIFFGASDSVGRFGQYRDFYLAQYWRELLTNEDLTSGVRFENVYVNRKNGHQFTSCDLFTSPGKALLLVRNFGVEHRQSTLEWSLPDGMEVTQALCDGRSFDFENGAPLPVFEHFVAVAAQKRRE